ncbi:MAG: hypothetical protein KGL25_02620 [Gammaproteobacteria bacterium]|nr:hypothetical protein [Gammaproteobacteria bacterium]MDE2250285.1 hypothetical protein [Gammaproteobacteria bacterium]
MSSESPWVVERFSQRWARVALVCTGAAFVALIGMWAVARVGAAWRGGHTLRGLVEAAIALLLVTLSLRIMALNWRATRPRAERPVPAADSADQSGVWGVGGPSMREPGSTGAWPLRRIDRRYEDSRD